VGWEYINGVAALINLLNMTEAAIERAGIKLYRGYPRSTALDSRGFYLNSNEIWCGVYYHDPLNVCLQIVDKTKFDRARLPSPTYDIEEDKDYITFSLGLEDCHFFSLNKDEQLETLTKFVKTSFEEAGKMRR